MLPHRAMMTKRKMTIMVKRKVEANPNQKVKRKNKDLSSTDLSARDREFLIDLIKTLFKEVNDINENSQKIS